uniref:Uncharacterized protein n=1 Tax=Chromera velia CCMP2878 TaxID=1169474 RepID=A0A0G4IB75_9ALVE|eukprot:Cvel_12678.t1-p1 / transcript=Cvel_12678.t1 / gene=Cvel_12678 / organism=Chromera_velia_CCMP2878 / gene_product=hypothetical protein / transcript_product=hypothetical protein / location=Cvel_scaffold838:43525-49703(-) / protein_length=1704 / sequence_SO=supercontig / SO=protein_coding / is_pseudo=false
MAPAPSSKGNRRDEYPKAYRMPHAPRLSVGPPELKSDLHTVKRTKDKSSLPSAALAMTNESSEKKYKKDLLHGEWANSIGSQIPQTDVPSRIPAPNTLEGPVPADLHRPTPAEVWEEEEDPNTSSPCRLFPQTSHQVPQDPTDHVNFSMTRHSNQRGRMRMRSPLPFSPPPILSYSESPGTSPEREKRRGDLLLQPANHLLHQHKDNNPPPQGLLLNSSRNPPSSLNTQCALQGGQFNFSPEHRKYANFPSENLQSTVTQADGMRDIDTQIQKTREQERLSQRHRRVTQSADLCRDLSSLGSPPPSPDRHHHNIPNQTTDARRFSTQAGLSPHIPVPSEFLTPRRPPSPPVPHPRPLAIREASILSPPKKTGESSAPLTASGQQQCSGCRCAYRGVGGVPLDMRYQTALRPPDIYSPPPSPSDSPLRMRHTQRGDPNKGHPSTQRPMQRPDQEPRGIGKDEREAMNKIGGGHAQSTYPLPQAQVPPRVAKEAPIFNAEPEKAAVVQKREQQKMEERIASIEEKEEGEGGGAVCERCSGSPKRSLLRSPSRRLSQVSVGMRSDVPPPAVETLEELPVSDGEAASRRESGLSSFPKTKKTSLTGTVTEPIEEFPHEQMIICRHGATRMSISALPRSPSRRLSQIPVGYLGQKEGEVKRERELSVAPDGMTATFNPTMEPPRVEATQNSLPSLDLHLQPPPPSSPQRFREWVGQLAGELLRAGTALAAWQQEKDAKESGKEKEKEEGLADIVEILPPFPRLRDAQGSFLSLEEGRREDKADTEKERGDSRRDSATQCTPRGPLSSTVERTVAAAEVKEEGPGKEAETQVRSRPPLPPGARRESVGMQTSPLSQAQGEAPTPSFHPGRGEREMRGRGSEGSIQSASYPFQEPATGEEEAFAAPHLQTSPVVVRAQAQQGASSRTQPMFRPRRSQSPAMDPPSLSVPVSRQSSKHDHQNESGIGRGPQIHQPSSGKVEESTEFPNTAAPPSLSQARQQPTARRDVTPSLDGTHVLYQAAEAMQDRPVPAAAVNQRGSVVSASASPPAEELPRQMRSAISTEERLFVYSNSKRQNSAANGSVTAVAGSTTSAERERKRTPPGGSRAEDPAPPSPPQQKALPSAVLAPFAAMPFAGTQERLQMQDVVIRQPGGQDTEFEMKPPVVDGGRGALGGGRLQEEVPVLRAQAELTNRMPSLSAAVEGQIGVEKQKEVTPAVQTPGAEKVFPPHGSSQVEVTTHKFVGAIASDIEHAVHPVGENAGPKRHSSAAEPEPDASPPVRAKPHLQQNPEHLAQQHHGSSQDFIGLPNTPAGPVSVADKYGLSHPTQHTPQDPNPTAPKPDVASAPEANSPPADETPLKADSGELEGTVQQGQDPGTDGPTPADQMEPPLSPPKATEAPQFVPPPGAGLPAMPGPNGPLPLSGPLHSPPGSPPGPPGMMFTRGAAFFGPPIPGPRPPMNVGTSWGHSLSRFPPTAMQPGVGEGEGKRPETQTESSQTKTTRPPVSFKEEPQPRPQTLTASTHEGKNMQQQMHHSFHAHATRPPFVPPGHRPPFAARPMGPGSPVHPMAVHPAGAPPPWHRRPESQHSLSPPAPDGMLQSQKQHMPQPEATAGPGFRPSASTNFLRQQSGAAPSPPLARAQTFVLPHVNPPFGASQGWGLQSGVSPGPPPAGVPPPRPHMMPLHHTPPAGMRPPHPPGPPLGRSAGSPPMGR